MPPEIYGPVDYSPIWLALAAVAVLVAVGWPVLTWWRGRAPKPVEPWAPPVVAPQPLRPQDVRASYLERITEVESSHRNGRLTDRQAHQQLSGVVRGFVSDVSGIPANRFTLADLQTALADQPTLTPVAEFVADLYSPSFAADAKRDVHDSVRDAREVVQQWN